MKSLKSFFISDLYSPEALRKRAEKVGDCPYALILQLCADQLEAGKVKKEAVQKVVEYARTGNQQLMFVAMKMLNLNQTQVDVALKLLEKMK